MSNRQEHWQNASGTQENPPGPAMKKTCAYCGNLNRVSILGTRRPCVECGRPVRTRVGWTLAIAMVIAVIVLAIPWKRRYWAATTSREVRIEVRDAESNRPISNASIELIQQLIEKPIEATGDGFLFETSTTDAKGRCAISHGFFASGRDDFWMTGQKRSSGVYDCGELAIKVAARGFEPAKISFLERFGMDRPVEDTEPLVVNVQLARSGRVAN